MMILSKLWDNDDLISGEEGRRDASVTGWLEVML